MVQAFLGSFPRHTVETSDGRTSVQYTNASSDKQGRIWGIVQTLLYWIRDGKLCPSIGTEETSGSMASGRETRRHMINFKWTRRLSKLRYEEIRPFVSQFRTYINAMGLNEVEAYMMLVQHCDQHPLLFIEALHENTPIASILDRLEADCKPPKSPQIRALLKLQQKRNEPLHEYTLRFNHVAAASGASQSRKKEVYLESLNNTWKVTTRSIVATDASINYNQLKQKLLEIAGPGEGDDMELNLVDKEEKVMHLEQSHVDGRGQIKFATDFTRMQELLATIETSVKNSTGWPII